MNSSASRGKDVEAVRDGNQNTKPVRTLAPTGRTTQILGSIQGARIPAKVDDIKQEANAKHDPKNEEERARITNEIFRI